MACGETSKEDLSRHKESPDKENQTSRRELLGTKICSTIC